MAKFSVLLLLVFHLYSNAQNNPTSSSNIVIYGNAQLIDADLRDQYETVQSENLAKIEVLGSAKIFCSSDTTDQSRSVDIKIEVEEKQFRELALKNSAQNQSIADIAKPSEKPLAKEESFISSKSKEQILNANTFNNSQAILNFTNLVLKVKGVLPKISALRNLNSLELCIVQKYSRNISIVNQMRFLESNPVRSPPFFMM